MKIIKPSIYDEFECLGKDCIFTCCGGWGIPVEEEVYTKCSEYKEKIEYDSKWNIYKIKMDGRAMCPFLDESQLCTLVLGGKDLSITCQEFPRMCILTTAKEKSMMLDCPHVVELLEKLKKPLTFLTEEDGDCSGGKSEEAGEWMDDIIQDQDIRDRMMGWLQKRELPLWYRLFLTAFCLNKIKGITGWDGKKREVDKIMSRQYYEMLLEGIRHVACDRQKQFEEIRFIIIQLNTFLLLPLMDDKSGSKNRVIRLMAKNQDCSFEEYQESYHRWAADKAAEFEPLMENVIVYQWFQQALQINGKYYMWNNFLTILLEFFLIRHFSILSYSIWGGYTAEDLRFMTAFASRAIRARKGDSGYEEWIEEAEKGSLSVANLLFLLK